MNPVRKQIGERLRQLRKENRYTQRDCANALGVGQATYADMELGKCRVRRRDLVTLSVFYGTTVDVAFPDLLPLVA